MDLDTTGDYATAIDGLEVVTLLRNGGRKLTLPHARRIHTHSTALGGSDAPPPETRWDIAWPAGEAPPRPGDRLRPAGRRCGVIVRTEHKPTTSRYVCIARDLHERLNEFLQIQEAIWQDLGTGLEIVDWVSVLPPVAGAIEARTTDVDLQADPTVTETTASFVLDTDYPLNENHRIARANGELFRVERFVASASAGELARAEAVRIIQSA